MLVAATGNDGSTAAQFPAGDAGVIGVSATDASDASRRLDNYGARRVPRRARRRHRHDPAGGGYGSVTGTSASAAIVAGAAALLKATSRRLERRHRRPARSHRGACRHDRQQTGNGRLTSPAPSRTPDRSVKPAGAAPVGSGGPFVGPYVAGNITSTGATLNGLNSVAVAPGATLSAIVNATVNGGGSTTAWNSTGWEITTTDLSAGTAKLAHCVDTPNHTSAASETFPVTAPLTPGSYRLVIAFDADDGIGSAACGGGTNQVRLQRDDAVVVFTVSATLNGTSSVTVAPGASISAAVTLSTAAPVSTWRSTGWAIGTTEPTFGTKLPNCVDTTDATGAAQTRTFTITAPAIAGIYNAQLRPRRYRRHRQQCVWSERRQQRQREVRAGERCHRGGEFAADGDGAVGVNERGHGQDHHSCRNRSGQ